MAFSYSILVFDSSSVGQARRQAIRATELVQFDEIRAAEAAIVATEAARNALIHGGGGELLVSGDPDADNPAIQLLALDKGQGIRDVSKALSDGYSTSGTPGTGLGAIRRISSHFELYTGPDLGTVLLSEIRATPPTLSSLQIAGLAIPAPGEKFCGDAWYSSVSPIRTALLLVDGLGHGPGAAEAADEAGKTFSKWKTHPPVEMLGALHDALKKTRGAAAFVAVIHHHAKLLEWAGVGNISGSLFSSAAARSLVSYNGTLGVAFPRVQQYQHAWDPGSTLILHSDGLYSRWDLSKYRGLFSRHPAVIAGILLRDFRRGRDDASVLVAKSAID